MSQQIKIGIPMYPDAQLSAVYGLMDLFFSANRIAMEKNLSSVVPLLISRWQVFPELERVEKFESLGQPSRESLEQLTVVIVPPNLNSQGKDVPNAILLEWLKEQHQGGAILCSICTAAFILAHTGLLSDRPATTHWALKNMLSNQFPDIQVQIEQMVIEDGDIITAAGVTAWIDLGLCLIDRFLGPSIMLEVAQFFLVDPHGREQRFYSKFSPQLYHGDTRVLSVQHWLQTNYHQSISTADMASVAVLGERTFLRRFKKATGLKPREYVQTLRVAKAREMLEFSKMSFDEITGKVGYADSGAFRKIFQRLMGLQPSEYRRRFSVYREDQINSGNS